MNTVVFNIVVEASAADVVCDRLWAGGVLAIEELPTHESGAEKEMTQIRSSFGVSESATVDRLRALLDDIVPEATWTVTAVDPDVADTWKEFARPVFVGSNLVVVPAWLADAPRVAPVDNDSIVRVLIDPGATFGMGDHPTSRGSLEMLARVLHPGDTIADIGCGSGILGIAAIRLGADRAVGVDINPAAVPVSLENARRNHVEDRWKVSLDGADSLDEVFEVVVANILAPVLIELSDALQGLLAPGGTLIVSGILADRHDHVLRALQPLSVVDSIVVDGWATLALRA